MIATAFCPLCPASIRFNSPMTIFSHIVALSLCIRCANADDQRRGDLGLDLAGFESGFSFGLGFERPPSTSSAAAKNRDAR